MVKLVNGLHLFSALSSSRTPKLFTQQSVSTHSYTHPHTDYIVAAAALGQTARSKADHLQRAMTQQLRQMEEQWLEPATHQLQDKLLPPEPQCVYFYVYI
ncbi:hypothetical protein AMECASPLE_023546 [Ameca splendens]|uniref:Uncharacterized protein n=1 Tax=Ameca splendens TaxID=208324 RepID=A0ABV0XT02_9TELE